MDNSETAAELHRLRTELEALKNNQAMTQGASTSSADPHWNSDEINEQLERVAGLVKDKAQERPLLTLLVVFALGLLFGRLLR